jgi:integrase
MASAAELRFAVKRLWNRALACWLYSTLVAALFLGTRSSRHSLRNVTADSTRVPVGYQGVAGNPYRHCRLAQRELAGLKVDGIDWQAGTICIEQSVWQGKLQTPKTRTAIRTFAISSYLVQRLRNYRRNHWTRNDLGLMFASKRGNPLSIDSFRNRVLNSILKQLGIDKKVKAMGIKRCGNYAFRHMNATAMDEIGTTLKTRQHRLGHSWIETTMAHYTHKVDADDRVPQKQSDRCYRRQRKP